MNKILVVDDEKDIRDLLVDIFSDEEYEVLSASNGTEAINLFKNHQDIEAVILDIWLEGSDVDGIGVLEAINHFNPDIPIVMISGHANIEIAVQSIKMGAYDFVQKPFTEDKILTTTKRAIENFYLKKENSELKKKIYIPEIIGRTSVVSQLRSNIQKAAQTSSRVLINGQAGSGKRLTAQLIHKESKRSSAPFISFRGDDFNLLNDLECVEQKIQSLFSKADKGILYVSEVTSMPVAIQAIFLKHLQQSEFDVRVIASSNYNIEHAIKSGKFREDLYYRLNVSSIHVPCLSERKEDIEPLCNHFINQFVEFSNLKRRKLSEDSIAALQLFEWPGNIRQLKNVIEWLLIMIPGGYDDLITANDLPHNLISKKAAIAKPDSNVTLMSLSLREAREVFERQYLAAQVIRFNGNISKTSSFIGMERSALHRKLKSLNIIIDNSNDNNENAPETHVL